jgi:hypothetical protein
MGHANHSEHAKPLLAHSSLTDRGIAVTLEATGDAQIRIWRKQGETFSEVSLPYSLGRPVAAL